MCMVWWLDLYFISLFSEMNIKSKYVYSVMIRLLFWRVQRVKWKKKLPQKYTLNNFAYPVDPTHIRWTMFVDITAKKK